MKAAIYVRVSTADQDLEQQIEVLREEVKRRGWELVGIYAEKVSGASRRRPELQRLRTDAAMRRFRAVLVWSISRLGRDLVETLTVARELFQERGVAVVSYTQAAIDMSTPNGQLVFSIFAAVAEAQLLELRQSTKRGLARAVARGVKLGRPRKGAGAHQVRHLVEINANERRYGAVARAVKQTGLSRATIKRRLAEARRTSPEGQRAEPGPALIRQSPQPAR